MQTIYLDISNRSVIPVIYAKQGDVGRKVEVVLTNSGLPYEPEAGSAFSAWFSGASGMGNYTDIGDQSAFTVSGNKVTVELITQMLQNAGEGILCLVLSRANGEQIGLWNIRYICEGVPGAGSEPAKDYYTAFSQAVAGLAYPDASLSVKGKAADAAVVGEKFNQVSEDISLQKARVDNLSTLKEGSTTGDAELIDIRVGVDGVQYANAGEAVRNQVANVKKNLQSKFKPHISDYFIIIPGKSYAVVSGVFKFVDDDTAYTVFVPVSKMLELKCFYIGCANSRMINGSQWCISADEKYNYISHTNSLRGYAKVGINTVYFAFSFDNDVDYQIDGLYDTGADGLTDENKELPNDFITSNLFTGMTDFDTDNWVNGVTGYNKAPFKATNLIHTDKNLVCSIAPNGYSIYALDGSLITGNQGGAMNVTEECYVVLFYNNTVDTSSLIVTRAGETIGINDKYLPDVVSAYIGTTWSAMGDSLTADGIGTRYHEFITQKLGLSQYLNCAKGGSRMSGTGDTCLWRTEIVEKVSLDSSIVTIMIGTNDSPWTTVQDSDFTVENHDTNNFVGAFNVCLSKLFYKFLKLPAGYYTDIDYSGLTQVETVNPDFRIVIIGCPQKFDSIEANEKVRKFCEYDRKIAQMWGITFVDPNDCMQMNFMTYPADRTDKVHFPQGFHKKLAEGIIGKVKMFSPITF